MSERWIIVGAGSAGCVLANRLSADGSRDVLLLDDGPDLVAGSVPAGIDGPSFFAAMAEPGRIHPDLLATRAPGIEPTVYQRGRGIGGSGAVNAMIALRGSDALYQSWGWHDVDQDWDSVLLVTEPAAEAEVGPVDGALRSHPLGEAAQMTRRNGRRVTSAEAYLWPVLERDNLTVRPNTRVQSVLLRDRTATGVQLVDGTEIPADRIIMAAGAIHSPVILLRSGIEPQGLGQGLQDHPSAVLTLLLKPHVAHDPTGLPIASVMHAHHGDDLLQVLPMNNLGPAPETAGFGALMAALMTPTGRSGSVSIDADGQPVIDFAFLDNEHDLHALTVAVRLTLDVLESEPFRKIVHHAFIDEHGTSTDTLTDDAAIHAWLRTSCGDYVHATSTCAMGTVVDDLGAVVGYDALHVIDASIFPSIPDANTHLPTTMLAERISRLLTS